VIEFESVLRGFAYATADQKSSMRLLLRSGLGVTLWVRGISHDLVASGL